MRAAKNALWEGFLIERQSAWGCWKVDKNSGKRVPRGWRLDYPMDEFERGVVSRYCDPATGFKFDPAICSILDTVCSGTVAFMIDPYWNRFLNERFDDYRGAWLSHEGVV